MEGGGGGEKNRKSIRIPRRPPPHAVRIPTYEITRRFINRPPVTYTRLSRSLRVVFRIIYITRTTPSPVARFLAVYSSRPCSLRTTRKTYYPYRSGPNAYLRTPDAADEIDFADPVSEGTRPTGPGRVGPTTLYRIIRLIGGFADKAGRVPFAENADRFARTVSNK